MPPGARRRHAAHFEAEFLRDMRDVGCRDPTVLTRVSEYMDVIVAYTEKIVANGFAYAANGSVYFDTQAFRRVPGRAATHGPCVRGGKGELLRGSRALQVPCGAPAGLHPSSCR